MIIGVERRRFWSDDQKLSILREVGICDATVTDVARRHDVTRQHIYQWRRQLRDKGLWSDAEGAAFLALDVAEFPVASKPMNSASAEIVFANGRTLRCPAGMAEADIMRLIQLVETA